KRARRNTPARAPLRSARARTAAPRRRLCGDAARTGSGCATHAGFLQRRMACCDHSSYARMSCTLVKEDACQNGKVVARTRMMMTTTTTTRTPVNWLVIQLTS
ncbi:hypothetical protein HDU82_002830, partial [Entophlyctis luteolus]